MPSAISYQRREVVSQSGERLGSVAAVLFHPREPRVVGLQVDRGSALGVFDRAPAFVQLGGFSAEGADAVRLAFDKLPADAAGEKELGYSWQQTVIWRHMPVRSACGEAVGIVHDVVFDATSGSITKMLVSTGTVGDLALGRLDVPGDMVGGFDGESVTVLPGYAELRAEGGAAKVAAAGAAAIRQRAGQVGDGALQVGVAAAGALGRSLRRGAGRKALDKLKSLMGDDE